MIGESFTSAERARAAVSAGRTILVLFIYKAPREKVRLFPEIGAETWRKIAARAGKSKRKSRKNGKKFKIEGKENLQK